jgi:hypothetical protein
VSDAAGKLRGVVSQELPACRRPIHRRWGADPGQEPP